MDPNGDKHNQKGKTNRETVSPKIQLKKARGYKGIKTLPVLKSKLPYKI